MQSQHTSLPEKSIFNYSLLSPENGGFLEKRHSDGDNCILEGWALIPNADSCMQSTIPDRLLLIYDTQILHTFSPEIMRPDVPKCPDSPCGFKISYPLDSTHADINLFSVVAQSASGQSWMVVPKRSEWVQLEITGRCNLKCPQCPNSLFESKRLDELTLADIETIKPIFNEVTHGCLDGFGELFMSKHVKECIETIHWSKHFLFHTNGQLMDEERAHLILDNSPPIRKCIVSLDTLDPQKYTRLRAGGKLDRAITNVRRLVALRNERGLYSPRVGINLTLMKENVDELLDFVRFAADLDGFLELNFLYDSLLFDNSAKVNRDGWTFSYEEQKLKNVAEFATQIIGEAQTLAAELGVEISLTGSLWKSQLNAEPDELGYCGKRLPLEQCGCIDNTRMLLADGRMQYCVWQTGAMYNWRETKEINPRKHPRGQVVRELIKKGIIPKECSGAGCPWVGLRPQTETDSDADSSQATAKGGWGGAAS